MAEFMITFLKMDSFVGVWDDDYSMITRNEYEEEYDHFLENEWKKALMAGFHSYSSCGYALDTVCHASTEALLHTLMTMEYLSIRLEHLKESCKVKTKYFKTDTALHLAASRKQIQDKDLFLFGRRCSIPAMLDNVITALDMDLMLSLFHSNPPNIAHASTDLLLGIFKSTSKLFDNETSKVLGRSRIIVENRIQLLNDDKNHEVHISFGTEPYHPSGFNRVWFKPMQSDGGLSSRKNNHVLLLLATLNSILTLNVGLHPPKIISNSIGYKEDYLSLTQSFILFNSIGFFISMAMIVLLLQKYPLKPWPTFSVLALLVCYVFSTMAIFPNQSLDMLLLASSFALFATAWMFKMGFCSR